MTTVLSKQAKKQFFQLSVTHQIRIQNKLLVLLNNPYVGKLLKGQLAGLYTLRAWPYRILYHIDHEANQVVVLSIMHRQGAYKP